LRGNTLKLELNRKYGISVDVIRLTSDFCASVYLLHAAGKKYIFKLHRNFDTEIAIQSANIMDYLTKQSFPAAAIVPTKNGHLTIMVGDRTGTLFEYVDGTMGYDLDFGSFAAEMGETMARLHSAMAQYDKPLLQYGREHYAGRCIHVMKKLNYSPSKIDELDAFGDALWKIASRTKPGFCHGDLNPSNFIKTPDNQYVLFDFDCGGMAYPINDISTICNVTYSFEQFDIKAYDEPLKRLSLLKQGYEKHRKLDDDDLSAVLAFIGLNCYWMIAQFDKYRTPLEGRNWLSKDYFDMHYNWLMSWKECLQRNMQII